MNYIYWKRQSCCWETFGLLFKSVWTVFKVFYILIKSFFAFFALYNEAVWFCTNCLVLQCDFLINLLYLYHLVIPYPSSYNFNFSWLLIDWIFHYIFTDRVVWMISFAVSIIMNFRRTGLEFLLFDKTTDVSIGAAPPYTTQSSRN